MHSSVCRRRSLRTRWCVEDLRFSPLAVTLLLAALCVPQVACSGPKTAPTENDKSPPKSSPVVVPAACKISTLPQTGLQHGLARVATPAGEVEFDIELALNNKQRQVGLMCREHLGDKLGMLFVFDAMRTQSFWMKNTLIPLDMLFIDDTGVIVGHVLNATPMTTSPRRVSLPSKMVLELAAGAVKKYGLAPGQRVTFVNVPGAPTP